MTSLVLLAFGWAPRSHRCGVGLLAAFVVVGEFGSLWHLPTWVMDLSPLRHSPTLPVGSDGVLPVLVVLLAVAVVITVSGLGWPPLRPHRLTPSIRAGTSRDAVCSRWAARPIRCGDRDRPDGEGGAIVSWRAPG